MQACPDDTHGSLVSSGNEAVLEHRFGRFRRAEPMQSETNAGEKARARLHESTAENADDHRVLTDGGDDMPADPFDRSPEDYDVSDTLAALEEDDAEDDDDLPDSELATDGGVIAATDTRVDCFYCGKEATRFDQEEGVDVCDDCHSISTMTDAEVVRRARRLAPEGARYVMACFDCRGFDTFVQETEAVERARADDRTHACDCGGEYELVTDDDRRLCTDGGTTADPRVPCDYCGGNAIGYDLKEQANLCSDCAVFPSALVEGRSQVTQVDEFPAPPTDDESESSSRCIECGDLLVVRDGQDTRCVECLLDHLAVDPRPSPGVF